MRFQCPSCKGIVAVDNSDMGAQVQCGTCGEIITVPETRFSPGAVIDDFIIQKELGRGGMGVVYLAHQISLDRATALKILSDNLAKDSQFVASFFREARAAAKLNHPHIVQAYAVGEDEGVFFFAMEDIEGRTMKDVLAEQKIIPADQAMLIVQQIAEALNYAWHEQKLIHRDIKPDNIMLTDSGRAKLSDLGLASVAGDIDESNADEIMGTPQYISPEHLTGAPMDVRSDIYSLGATFYHFVTGRFPYEGKTAMEITQQHLNGTLIPPDQVNPSVPQNISNIILKMMARNPDERYQSAEDLVDDIRKVSHSISGVTGKINLNAAQPAAPQAKKTGMKLQIKTGGSKSGGMQRTGTQTKVMTQTVKKRQAQFQKKKLLIISGAAAAVVILLAAAIAIPLMLSKDKTPEAAAAVPAAPVETQLQKNLEKICAHAKFNNDSPEGRATTVTMTEELLATNPNPQTPGEKEYFQKLMEYYMPLDEGIVAANRKIAEEKLEQNLEKTRKAQEEEKQRAAEEERQKAEAERRKVQLAQEAKRKQEALAAKHKKAEQDVVTWKADAMKEIAAACSSASVQAPAAAAVEKVLTDYKSKLETLEKDEDKLLQNLASKDKPWIEAFGKRLKHADELAKTLSSQSESLKGLTFSADGKEYKVRLSKKKELMFLIGKGGVAKKYNKLSGAEKKAFTGAVAESIGAKAEMWLYYYICGQMELAAEAAGEDEDFKALSAIK